MPTYQYDAVDKAGRSTKGTIDGKTEAEAKAKLKKQGLLATSLSERGAKAKKGNKAAVQERKKSSSFGGAKSAEVTMFTRQFATLVDAGLPMVKALDIVEQMLKPGAMRNAIMDVRDEVEQGSTLSEAMAKCPRVFDDLYVSMIKAGEIGGMLSQILNRLADFREKSEKLRKAIIGALIYPAAVITIAGGILTLIVMFIVPKFKKMFEDMDVDMPTPTIMLMAFGDFLVNQWYMVPMIPITLIATFIGVRRTAIGKKYTDTAALYIPIFGIIISKSSVSRLCRTLGELSSSGVPILDSLNILKTSVGNAVVEEAVADIHTSIREGENIADPMRRHKIFDVMVVNMVEVGEETGELDKMLVKIADTYDNDVDTIVSSMMSLLEPFLIIGMGLAVGFIVVSLFLPLVSIIENM